MPPVLINAVNRLGFGSRVGGAGTMLNVNAGSKVSPDVTGMAYLSYRLGLGGQNFHDMIVYQGKPTVAHCELDHGMPLSGAFAAFYQCRGPYVQQWDGASWNLLGSAVDSATNSAPAGPGDRFIANAPRLASDGANLWLSYFDRVVTNLGAGTYGLYLRLAKWDGASWSEVASFGPVSTDGWAATASVCAVGGTAWCCFYHTEPTVNPSVFTLGETNVWVLRSDGASYRIYPQPQIIDYTYLATAATDAPGAPCAIVSHSGRALGIYGRARSSYASDTYVLFDLNTGAVLRETDMQPGRDQVVPYGTLGDSGFAQLSGYSALTADDRISFGSDRQGIVSVPDDGSDVFVNIGGSLNVNEGEWLTGSALTVCADPADGFGRQLWFCPTRQIDGPSNPPNVYTWQAACSATRFPGNPINTGPPFLPYLMDQVPIIGDPFLLANHNVWEIVAPVPVCVIGDTLYALTLYSTLGVGGTLASPQQNWSQFIVYEWTIDREAVFSCSNFSTPVFQSRLKHHDL